MDLNLFIFTEKRFLFFQNLIKYKNIVILCCFFRKWYLFYWTCYSTFNHLISHYFFIFNYYWINLILNYFYLTTSTHIFEKVLKKITIQLKLNNIYSQLNKLLYTQRGLWRFNSHLFSMAFEFLEDDELTIKITLQIFLFLKKKSKLMLTNRFTSFYFKQYLGLGWDNIVSYMNHFIYKFMLFGSVVKQINFVISIRLKVT